MEKYFKAQYYKGKNKFARIMDYVIGTVFICIVIFIACFYTFLNIRKSIVIALLVGIFYCLARYLISHIRYRAFRKKTYKELEEKCMLQKLILQDASQISEYAQGVFETFTHQTLTKRCGGFTDAHTFYYAFLGHPDCPININQVIDVYRAAKQLGRSHILCISTGPFETNTKAFCEQHGFRLVEKDELIKLDASMHATYEEIKKYAEYQLAANKKQKVQLIAKQRSKVYFTSAAMLLAVPILTGFNIFYVIMCVACVALGVACLLKDRTKPKILQ